MSKAKARRAAASSKKSSKKKAVLFVQIICTLSAAGKFYRMALDQYGRVWEYRERIGWLLLEKDAIRIEKLDAEEFPPDAKPTSGEGPPEFSQRPLYGGS